MKKTSQNRAKGESTTTESAWSEPEYCAAVIVSRDCLVVKLDRKMNCYSGEMDAACREYVASMCAPLKRFICRVPAKALGLYSRQMAGRIDLISSTLDRSTNEHMNEDK